METIRYASIDDLETHVEMHIRFLNEFIPPADPTQEGILREALTDYMRQALDTGEYVGLLGFSDGKLASAGRTISIRCTCTSARWATRSIEEPDSGERQEDLQARNLLTSLL